MSDSLIDRVQKTMQRLLWENVLRGQLAILFKTVPVLGWPVISDVVLFIINTYLVEPLFESLSRFGVFTSIDWRDDAQYEAYKKEALKIVTAQDKNEWPADERKAFRDAAKNLIRFHIAA